METKTQGARNLAFLLSEGNGSVSREVATIVTGEGFLEAGTVLGKVTTSGKYAETAVAVLAYAVDATDADAQAVIIDGAGGVEVKSPLLKFHSSVNDAAKRSTKLTQLRAVGIKAR